MQTNREWSFFVDSGQQITTYIIRNVTSYQKQVVTFNPWAKFFAFLSTTHIKLPGNYVTLYKQNQ